MKKGYKRLPFSEEWKHNLSVSKKGKKVAPFSEEHKRNLSKSHKGKPSPRKGTKCSDETKKKISESNLGKVSPRKGAKLSEETKQKIRVANVGKRLPEEVRLKIGRSLRGRKAWNKGKKYKSIKGSVATTGEKNPNWRGGISFGEYSSEWTDYLKESIRKRDKYVCQMCGIHQDELSGFIKVFDIHHIDYIKDNLNPENLITLCRSCHMKTNYNRNNWIIYFGGIA